MRIKCRLLTLKITVFVVSTVWQTTLVKVRLGISSNISKNLPVIERII